MEVDKKYLLLQSKPVHGIKLLRMNEPFSATKKCRNIGIKKPTGKIEKALINTADTVYQQVPNGDITRNLYGKAYIISDWCIQTNCWHFTDIPNLTYHFLILVWIGAGHFEKRLQIWEKLGAQSPTMLNVWHWQQLQLNHHGKSYAMFKRAQSWSLL